MALIGPVFPESLPPKQMPKRPTPRTAKLAGSTGVANIIFGFLAFGVVSNLALTLYTHREKEVVKAVEASTKETQLLEEMTRIRSELTHSRTQLADMAIEITRMKVAYQTVIAQVGNVSTVAVQKFFPSAPMNSQSGQPNMEKR